MSNNIKIFNLSNNLPLCRKGGLLVDSDDNKFAIINGAPKLPETLPTNEIREWSTLYTFDQYSSEYDNSLHFSDFLPMLEKNNVIVTFAGPEYWSLGNIITIVRE